MLSILVCTRNRPDSLGRTVRSLLASDDPSLELIVVDQSDAAVFTQALGAFKSDPRLRHVRSGARGKGAALNEGLRLARSEIVVCTDDDCEAPSGWAHEMARALEEQTAAAVLFCSVSAPPCDWDAGYIPTYQIPRSRLLRSLFATCSGHGMGAGMALRRDIVMALGGFDEEVGPGARFPSADDWDIEHRALLSGWGVYEASHLSIIHHGFRTLAQGREHAHRDWFAIGGVCAKPIRAGHVTALVLPIWYFSIHAVWPPLSDLLRFRRPRGWSRIAGFVDGFVQGVRTPVSRPGLLFEPKTQPPGRSPSATKADSKTAQPRANG